MFQDKQNNSILDITKNIIEKCKKNDRKAQEVLYKFYASKMFGVCLRYYSNVEVAQDILQDGFIKVFQNIGSYRNEGSIEGWIRRIMVNTALEYHRKNKEYLEVEVEGIGQNQASYSHIPADYQLLLNIVSTLPNQYRIVFNLYAIEGYSHKEIAEQLNITESTSKSNYSRARVILKEKIAKITDYEQLALLRTRTI